MQTDEVTHLSSDLWGITCLFTPERSINRLLNYRTFRYYSHQQHLPLLAVELVRVGQPFQLFPEDADILIQITHDHVLWQKEALLNIALRYLPSCCRKVCWLDSDIIFKNENWVHTLSQQLNKDRVIQIAQDVMYLNEELASQVILGIEHPWNLVNNTLFASKEVMKRNNPKYGQWLAKRTEMPLIQTIPTSIKLYKDNFEHFSNGKWGFGWAAHLSDLRKMGGFYDYCIVGGGDTILYNAFLHHNLYQSFRERFPSSMLSQVQQYINKSYQIFQKKVNYLPCSIYHLWHGNYKNRNYFQRHDLLKEGNFRPTQDVKHDYKGCLVWNWNHLKTLTPSVQNIKRKLIQNVEEYLSNRCQDDDVQKYESFLEEIWLLHYQKSQKEHQHSGYLHRPIRQGFDVWHSPHVKLQKHSKHSKLIPRE